MPIFTLRRTAMTFLIGSLAVPAGSSWGFAQSAATPAPPVPAAAPAPASLLDPDAVIPLDPAVKTGMLPNGLHYYIRKNSRPEKRVMLQLAVQAHDFVLELFEELLLHLD